MQLDHDDNAEYFNRLGIRHLLRKHKNAAKKCQKHLNGQGQVIPTR